MLRDFLNLSRYLLLGLACGVLGQGAFAQKASKEDAWKKDPYTQGEPAAMKKMGYVSFGPLVWGDDHDSRKIHDMMPEAKILWLETAHFRIGSSLQAFKLPKSSKARRRILLEVKELAKRLPRVKSKPRSISPWLRLHLYAARLERIYSQWQSLLAVSDSNFPSASNPLPRTSPKYMGRGPYLGMPDKFSVLLLKKASNLTRYAVKNGQAMPKEPTPICVNFLERGSILFGTCSEIIHHSLDPDHRLHSHIIFNTSLLMIRGFKDYTHIIPAWIREGAANYIVRKHDPDTHDFSGMKNWNKSKAYPKEWHIYARRFAKNGLGSPSRKLCLLSDPSEMTFNEHICAWSIVDFLSQLDQGKQFAQFVARLKAPMPALPGKLPSYDTILAAQETALKDVFGFTYESLDTAWKQYAIRTYPRR